MLLPPGSPPRRRRTMSQQDRDPSSRRDPSSPATTFPLPPSSPGLALPPISSIYNFVSADTASAPDRIPQPPSTSSSSSWPPAPPPAPPHDHRGDADHASSLGLWTTTTTTTTTPADGDGDGDDYDDDTNFVYEHGRRYHANADGRVLYPLPNDESEQERDDMKHKLALWMMHGRLFYAPVEDVMERGGVVFDLGTGTGEWAMEMAQRYTRSQIFGCDLSPIQPAYVWDNVFFATGDFEEDWADHDEGSFDYIHMRYAAFSIKDPEALVQRAMRYLKPGGYLEFQEMVYWPQADDTTLTATTPYAFRDFCYYMQQGLARLGLGLHTASQLPALLRAAGFDAVVDVRHKLPIGRWARDRRQREKGVWFLRMILMEGLAAICRRPFCRGLGWGDVQVEMFLVDVRRSLEDAGVHAYFPFTVVYGRKPPLGEEQQQQDAGAAAAART